MKSLKRSLLPAAFIAVMGFSLSLSASAQALQDSLRRDDDDIVSSIAPYASDVRDAILDVSQYPQKLVKIERMQARTSQAFQDLVEKYPRDVQEKIYDLSRYPDLINQLTANGNAKSASEVSSLVASYPKEVAADVNDLYPSHFSDLQSMNKTYQQSEETMQGILSSLSPDTQANFRKIIAMPDVMNILTDRIDLTVSLGEAYKNDPDGVRKNLTDMNAQVTSQNAKDLDDYKKKVASDPQLQQEMKNSSQEFANSYSETDDGNVPVVNNYYNSNPYPYWFGYPYWYPSAVWYPQPLYYHTGFYVGGGGNVVVVGLPSYAYSNWFFGYGYRRYPRLYGQYNAYYGYHYRPNYNVYRGYNISVRDHFNYVNHIGNQYNNSGNRGRTPTYNNRSNPQGGGNVNNGRTNPNYNSARTSSPPLGNRSQNFRNSGNIQNNNFNTQRYNNFNSQQFHQQNWGTMRGGGSRGSFNGGNFGGSRGNFGGGGARMGGGGGGGGGRHR